MVFKKIEQKQAACSFSIIMRKKLFLFIFILSTISLKSQDKDSSSISATAIAAGSAAEQKNEDTIKPTTSINKIYLEKNGDSFYCIKPKTFSFFTHIPKDFAGYVKQSFQKKNLYKTGIVVGATALLLVFDQQINDGVQSFARRNNISAEEDFDPIFRPKLFGKNTNIGKWPKNFNTAVYNFGQGSTVMWMAAGFFIAGKIKQDNRALQTASQLVESFLALGASTQILKYSTGRQTPGDATVKGGRWQPFPSVSDFNNHKSKFDAFPSGHLATFVSAITIVAENYPRVKWIKPVGYTIAGLLSFAMMNNGVHWAGDYPLGFALGYGFGKFITKKNHIRLKNSL
jgi:PAP2 superfamily